MSSVPAPAVSLAEGWSLVFSNTHGRWYYHHLETDTSQWEPPAPPASARDSDATASAPKRARLESDAADAASGAAGLPSSPPPASSPPLPPPDDGDADAGGFDDGVANGDGGVGEDIGAGGIGIAGAHRLLAASEAARPMSAPLPVLTISKEHAEADEDGNTVKWTRKDLAVNATLREIFTTEVRAPADLVPLRAARAGRACARVAHPLTRACATD